MKSDISSMKSKNLTMKGQHQENTEIIKALLHNQEVINAKLENLEVNTTSKEGLFDLSAKIDTLNTRLFYQ